MKISYNWLKDYLAFNLPPADIGEILTNTGLEVESIEVFESVKGGLKNVVIGEIVECEKHPDADKLKVTKVNAGSGELLQIVCGAPNCRVGLKSPVALVGAELYPSEGDKINIKKARIRGVESSGMICAEDELGLGNSHAGIMELDLSLPVGLPAAEYFNVVSDYIFEIGLTPNRSDAFSHIGVARDLSAALAVIYHTDLPLLKPDSAMAGYVDQKVADKLKIRIEDPASCPRYSGICIEGIKVEASPAWLKNRLLSIGLRPINNVVDITNFVLHEYGQPLHAFDASKIRGGTVIVKKLPAGSLFRGLDGTERRLSDEDLMICDAEGGMCIAGVFGGAESGVSESTTEIFLESAHFDPVSVRKTAARHNLRTDAAMHFEKTCDINATVEVLMRAASLICTICGGQISSPLYDLYSSPVEPWLVTTSIKRICDLAGVTIDEQTLRKILHKLEIKIEDANNGNLRLLVPTFRAEVRREADILEEVLRIYGYNNIPLPASLRSSVSFTDGTDQNRMENLAAALLTGMGFTEISTNSLTNAAFEQDEKLLEQQVKLLNSQTAEIDSLRTSMLYSGLEVIAYNQNRKNSDLRLYEIGKTYHKSGNTFKQKQHLVMFLTGNDETGNWLSKGKKYDFFQLKSYVVNLLERFGISGAEFNTIAADANFDYRCKVETGRQVIAEAGLVSRRPADRFDIRQEVYFATIDWDLLSGIFNKHKVTYEPLPKYPAVRRDLALVVDESLPFAKIEALALQETKGILQSVSLFDVYKGEKIEAGKKSCAVSFVFINREKTLTDVEIDKTVTRLTTKLEQELGAVIRK